MLESLHSESATPELIAVAFPSEDAAQTVRDELLELQRLDLVDLEHSAVVIKDEHGRVRLRELRHEALATTARGSVWGLLLGTLFAAPIVGAAVGATVGALSGALSDLGIDDAFMRELGTTLAPRTSALFLLVHDADPNKVVEAMQPYGGRVLRTSLKTSDEAKLRFALEGAGGAAHQLSTDEPIDAP